MILLCVHEKVGLQSSKLELLATPARFVTLSYKAAGAILGSLQRYAAGRGGGGWRRAQGGGDTATFCQNPDACFPSL